MQKQQKPIISVIMPVYNVEKYLKYSIESILNQTFQNFELICVDDGSTDNSLKILNTYQTQDARIHIIKQKNEGPSSARNNGLQQSRGEYIYFIDSDDIAHPQLLETVYYYAHQFDVDLVCFSYQKNTEKNLHFPLIEKEKISYFITSNPLFLTFKTGKKQIHFNVWTKFYKKTLLENIEFIDKIHFQDYPHTFAVLAKHAQTLILNQILYFYTFNPNSISNQKINVKQIEDHWKALDFIEKTYRAPELKKERRFIIKNLIPNILKKELKLCQKSNAEIAPLMYQKFALELQNLHKRGLIKFGFHRLDRYLIYLKLIKKGKL